MKKYLTFYIFTIFIIGIVLLLIWCAGSFLMWEFVPINKEIKWKDVRFIFLIYTFFFSCFYMFFISENGEND